jgi:hypothetical protein
MLKHDLLSGIVYHGTTLEIAEIVKKDGFRGLEFDVMLEEILRTYGTTKADLDDAQLRLLHGLDMSYTHEHHLVSTTPSGETAVRFAGSGGEVPVQIERIVNGDFREGVDRRKRQPSRISGTPAVLVCRIKNFKGTEHYEHVTKWIEGWEANLINKKSEFTGWTYTEEDAFEHIWHQYVNFTCRPDQLELLDVLTGERIEQLKHAPPGVAAKTASRTLTPFEQERDEKFQELADAQRAAPEIIMLRASHHRLSAGIQTVVLEHVGDITNRMAQHFSFLEGQYDIVYDKVSSMLKKLENPHSFENEMFKNMRTNYGFWVEERNETRSYDVLEAEYLQLWTRYADAHAALTVYNDAQKYARNAAVALGRREFNTCILYLYRLKNILNAGIEHYIEEAGRYEPGKTASHKTPPFGADEPFVEGTNGWSLNNERQSDSQDEIPLEILSPETFKTAYKDTRFPEWKEFLSAQGGIENLVRSYDDYEQFEETLSWQSGFDEEQFESLPRSQQRKLVFEHAENELEGAYMDLVYNHEQRQFPLEIYRVVKLRSITDLRPNELGIYWTWDENAADAYWGMSSGEKYVIRALVQNRDIDWRGTLEANLHSSIGADEREIRLYEGTQLKVTGWKVKGENVWRQPLAQWTQMALTAAKELDLPTFEKWVGLMGGEKSILSMFGADETIDSVRRRFDNVTESLRHFVHFPLELYRELTVSSDFDDVNMDKIGIHWSAYEHTASAHWGSSQGHHVMVKAVVDESNIDWPTTIYHNIVWPVEEEITLKKGTEVKLLGYKEKHDGPYPDEWETWNKGTTLTASKQAAASEFKQWWKRLEPIQQLKLNAAVARTTEEIKGGLKHPQHIERRYNDIVQRYEWLYSFPKTVYREMTANGFGQINRGNIGIHWSTGEGIAKAWDGRDARFKYLLKAVIDESDVDWDATLYNNIMYPMEHEITLKKGVNVHLVGYKVMNNQGTYPEVWKPVEQGMLVMASSVGVAAFMAEYKANTRSGKGQNRIWGNGQEKVVVSCRPYVTDSGTHPLELLDTVELFYIFVPEDNREQGAGSEALSWLCEIADKHRVSIAADVNPADDNVEFGRLVEWYERFGFIRQSDEEDMGSDDWYLRKPAQTTDIDDSLKCPKCGEPATKTTDGYGIFCQKHGLQLPTKTGTSAKQLAIPQPLLSRGFQPKTFNGKKGYELKKERWWYRVYQDGEEWVLLLGERGSPYEEHDRLPSLGRLLSNFDYMESPKRKAEDARNGASWTLQNYAENTHYHINSFLRGVKGFIKEDIQTMVDSLDKAFAIDGAHDMTKEPTEVYRFITSSTVYDRFARGKDSDWVGKIITDKGFVSTSRNKSLIEKVVYRGNKVVWLHIQLPKGTKYLAINWKNERESLLDRGSQFKIFKRQRWGNVIELHVKLVGNKKAASKSAKGSQVVWHVAPREVRDSILKNGIKPDGAGDYYTKPMYDKYGKDGFFAFTDYYDAQRYAESFLRQLDKGEFLDVWECIVDCPMHNDETYYPLGDVNDTSAVYCEKLPKRKPKLVAELTDDEDEIPHWNKVSGYYEDSPMHQYMRSLNWRHLTGSLYQNPSHPEFVLSVFDDSWNLRQWRKNTESGQDLESLKQYLDSIGMGERVSGSERTPDYTRERTDDAVFGPPTLEGTPGLVKPQSRTSQH